MAFTPWDNPMGTDGFEFIEFAAPDPAALGALFTSMGFVAVVRHRHKNVTLYRQGDVNFIVNAETDAGLPVCMARPSAPLPSASTMRPLPIVARWNSAPGALTTRPARWS